jgi:hypothetical protein
MRPAARVPRCPRGSDHGDVLRASSAKPRRAEYLHRPLVSTSTTSAPDVARVSGTSSVCKPRPWSWAMSVGRPRAACPGPLFHSRVMSVVTARVSRTCVVRCALGEVRRRPGDEHGATASLLTTMDGRSLGSGFEGVPDLGRPAEG